MGEEAYGRRIRVAGNVVPGSILKADQGVRFTLEQEGHSLNIRYVGKDLLPDTFKDDAEAMAEGKLMPGGEFSVDGGSGQVRFQVRGHLQPGSPQTSHQSKPVTLPVRTGQ